MVVEVGLYCCSDSGVETRVAWSREFFGGEGEEVTRNDKTN